MLLFLIFRHTNVALRSSGGPMCMTFGTPTSQSSLTVTGERSWSEPEICLNKRWTAAPPSLPKVCPNFPPSWLHSFPSPSTSTPCAAASYVLAIYLLYAKLEEGYGLARHAMAVYERATEAVETEERHHMFNIYIKRAAEIYGVTYTRAIYQKAIEVIWHLCCW